MDDGISKWKNTLVGYFVDKILPFSVVKPKAFLLWVDYGLKEVRAMGDGLFLFIFNNVSGPQAILDGGLWFILKQEIILKKWSDDVDFKK